MLKLDYLLKNMCLALFMAASGVAVSNTPKLPAEIITNEMITQTIVKLINEYDKSEDENKLKIFLKQFLDLQLINKQVRDFLVSPRTKFVKWFAPDESLFLVAAQLNSYILCKLVLENSKVPEQDLIYAVLFAVTHKNKKLLDLIIANDTHGIVNSVFKLEDLYSLNEDLSNLNTELFNSIRNNSYMVIKYALLNGADVNFQQAESDNHTPLTFAISTHGDRVDKNIIKLLLAYGAKIEIQDGENHNALSWAVLKEAESVLKLLIKNGAALLINQPNEKGASLLMQGIFSGNYNTVKILLKCGADPNFQHEASSKYTALMVLARGIDSYDSAHYFVQLLLSYKADKDLKNKWERTAYDCAVATGNLDVAELLK